MKLRRSPPRYLRAFLVAGVALCVAAAAVLAVGERPHIPNGAVLAAISRPLRESPALDRSALTPVPTPGTLTLIIEPPAAISQSSRPVSVTPRSTPGTADSLATRPTAVFLGDSYTTGWNGSGFGTHGWPSIVSSTFRWKDVNLAVAGTGYLNPGWTGTPISSRVSAAIDQNPDVVIVAAGHNDSKWSAAVTGRAADDVLDRLRRALPGARLVIVGPVWPGGRAPARCLLLRNHLRARAQAIGATFVDPIGERWFAGSRIKLIGPDGIHPTDAGHRYMAERILADLAKGR